MNLPKNISQKEDVPEGGICIRKCDISRLLEVERINVYIITPPSLDGIQADVAIKRILKAEENEH